MSEENKAIVRRMAEEMVSKKNMVAFDELVSRDAKAHHVPPGMTPDFDGWKGLVGMVLGAFPDGRMNIEALVASDDKVVMRYTFKGTHGGDLMGVPATGKPVDFSGMVMERIAGGKIVEHWEQMDMIGVMQQIGAVPTPGE